MAIRQGSNVQGVVNSISDSKILEIYVLQLHVNSGVQMESTLARTFEEVHKSQLT